MPTYTYSCPKCRKQYEVFKSIVDNSIPICEEDQTKLRKIIDGGSFILIGSWPGKDIKKERL